MDQEEEAIKLQTQKWKEYAKEAIKSGTSTELTPEAKKRSDSWIEMAQKTKIQKPDSAIEKLKKQQLENTQKPSRGP